jgi:hypothetical protein
MRIRLDRYYSSARARHVPAGEYDAADPLLCGQASYLVANEIAVVVEEDAPRVVTKQVTLDQLDELIDAPAKKKGKGK